MNNLYECLLSLTRKAIYSDLPDPPLSEPPEDWLKLLQLAENSQLQGILFPVIQALPPKLAPPPELLSVLKERIMLRACRQMLANSEESALLKAACAQGIRPMAFKGQVLADLYPHPEMRFSSDADIFVSAEERASMEALMESQGYHKNNYVSKEYVPVYCCPGRLIVELHLRLWEDFNNDQTNVLSELDLTAEDKRVTVRIGGRETETLGYMEHLIYQIYHVVKHLSYKGIELRHFTDTTLFVNRYYDGIDFPRFWECMDRLGYTSFCNAFFRLCVHFLRMDKRCLSPRHADTPIDHDQLMAALMELGVKDSSDISAIASSAVYQAFHGDKKKQMSRIQIIQSLVFPRREALSYRYAYARQHAVLLPVAWINRIFSHFFMRKDRSTNPFSQSVALADQKMELLRDLKLL